MTELSPEICLKIREARKEAGLSQSVVAAEVGCKQSAISMFEQGDGTKLNTAVIEKLAKKFGIDLKAPVEKAVPAGEMRLVTEKGVGYCPNPHCPSNHMYEVDGRTFYRPDRTVADPVGGKFCALCGEILEKRCPNCGSPVHEGAVCSHCGESYVSVL